MSVIIVAKGYAGGGGAAADTGERIDGPVPMMEDQRRGRGSVHGRPDGKNLTRRTDL